jgi:hypothetical protein
LALDTSACPVNRTGFNERRRRWYDAKSLFAFEQVRQTFFYFFTFVLILYLENDGWQSGLYRKNTFKITLNKMSIKIEIVFCGFEIFSWFKAH